MFPISQKDVSPANTRPWASAVYFMATAAVVAKDLVILDGAGGSDYAIPKASPASSAAAVTVQGIVLVAEGAVVAGEIGIAFPWRLLNAVNTAAGAIGDPVYASTGGDWSLSAGTVSRVVGEILKVGTTDGVIMLNPTQHIVQSGGALSASSLSLLDNASIFLGTGVDDTIVHNGTLTSWTHITGNLNFDNQAATGATYFTLGTDSAATEFAIRNDTETRMFLLTGAGALTLSTTAASAWNHTTGAWTFDNQNATGQTVFVLGDDTAATSFQVTNDSAAIVFKADAFGHVSFDQEVTATIAVADASGGATTALLTLDLQRADEASVLARPVQVMIATGVAQYVPRQAVNGNVTFGTATKGSIIDSGSGWALVETDAAGEFDCTATNAADEAIYFWVESANKLSDPTDGCVVLGSNSDLATWAA
jgi:hypothetical protein